jgi:hypothetical protein
MLLPFRPEARPLSQGERIYSLGNPLDVGFAVAEGTYNGVVRRGFYPQIFFGGALSAGNERRSGARPGRPGRRHQCRAPRRRRAGQLPGASELCGQAAGERPLGAAAATAAYDVLTTQLMAHQAALADRFIDQGWKSATHPRYQVPVPPDVFMRCWGSSEPSRTGGLDVERSDCAMDTRIFAGDFSIGTIALRHESYDGSRLGPLRFAARYSQSFRNERFVRLVSEFQTKPQCHEDFVDRAGCRCAP